MFTNAIKIQCLKMPLKKKLYIYIYPVIQLQSDAKNGN
jgi:hypothetical protein